jgi:agmatinase
VLNRNIEAFLGCDAEYSEAGVVLYGAPFDGTTSYRPGARFGSRHIRAESYGIESYSPYQDKDLTDYKVFDSGDLELPIGDTVSSLDRIYDRANGILSDGKLPFLLGGEHLVTLPAARAVFEKYPDLRIIHFDAHADLREDYLGVKLSHASVIRRCWEMLGDGRIYQFGIRSGDREEFRFAEAGHVKMQKFDFTGLTEILANLKGFPVYLTIDLDVMDPSCFPGTGTPEPGGVTFLELLRAATAVAQNANVVGCDLVELSPALDASGASTAATCKLVREILLALNH